MIYYIIPARSGSKGVPNKNILELNGIPLIGHCVLDAIACNRSGEIIVSTDSPDYVNVANKYGNVKGLIRNSLTSHDRAKDIDYLLHAVFKLDLNMDDVLVILRPTTPIRKPEVIAKAIDKFIEVQNSFESLRSMHPLSEAPEKMFRLDKDNTCKPIYGTDIEMTNMPRQNFEDAYHPNGYVDIVPVKTVVSTKTAFGKKIYGYVTEETREVDTAEDFIYLEKLFK
jgi:CMP-N,N'-diacetyllegionaminic acid synthase